MILYIFQYLTAKRMENQMVTSPIHNNVTCTTNVLMKSQPHSFVQMVWCLTIEPILKLNVITLSMSTAELENMSVSNLTTSVMLGNRSYYNEHQYYGFINFLMNFVEEPEEGIDERCYRANGFFNHEGENICSK